MVREPHPVELAGAKAIGPAVPPDWATTGASPLYWIAHKDLSLSESPRSATIAVACDRHYEIYVNSRRLIWHRNFFNGDRHIYAQRWEVEPAALRTGANSVDVVVRSDPWQCKNHRALAPLLLLTMTVECPSESVAVATDGDWELSLISDWREEIGRGANGTIHFERVRLSTADQAELSGFSSCMKRSTRTVERDPRDLPPLLLWNDPPKRTAVHRPAATTAAGWVSLPEEALLVDEVANLGDRRGATLSGIVEASEGAEQLNFAVSALLQSTLSVGGERIWSGGEATGIHQMPLPDYLVPAGSALQSETGGTVAFAFDLVRPPAGWIPFRLSVHEQARTTSVLELRLDGQLLSPRVVPLVLSESVGAQSLREDESCLRPGDDPSTLVFEAAGQSRCVVLDFGSLVTARLSMKITSHTPVSIHLAYGSTYSDGAVDCQRMHMRMVDVLDAPAGTAAYEAFDVRTFRFLEVLVPPSEADVIVEDIRAEERIYLDIHGRQPETSDPAVTAVWSASLHTARLCCNELFMDNPEREHAQWMDCTLAVASAAYYSSGEERKTQKALREVAWTQQDDGQVAGYAPGKWFPRLPLQGHMAYLVLGWHRHFMHTGDLDFVLELLPAIVKMIDHWETHVGARGLIEDLHTVFVDWGSHIYSYGKGGKGRTGALTTLNAYYLGALRRTAEVLAHLEKGSEELRARAEALAEAMRTHLFDPRLGIFRDGVGEPVAESNYSQTANVLAVLFGAAPPGTGRSILTSVFDPSADLISSIPGRFIPANAHFARQVGMALFEAGCDETALEWLTRGFVSMTRAQPGTLWETWGPHASRCQATGAAAAFLFPRYLAGLYPHTPGYRSVGLDPHPGSLSWLDAQINTPGGAVDAYWRRTGDSLQYRLILPAAWKGREIVVNRNSPIEVALRVEYRCDP